MRANDRKIAKLSSQTRFRHHRLYRHIVKAVLLHSFIFQKVYRKIHCFHPALCVCLLFVSRVHSEYKRDSLDGQAASGRARYRRSSIEGTSRCNAWGINGKIKKTRSHNKEILLQISLTTSKTPMIIIF